MPHEERSWSLKRESANSNTGRSKNGIGQAGAAPTVAAVQKLTVVESTTLIPEAIDRCMLMRTMGASCNSHRSA